MSSTVEKLKRRKSSQVTKVNHESSMGSSQKKHQPNLSNTKQEDLESSLVNNQKDLVAMYPKASSISKSESHSATERDAIQSLCNDLIFHSTWNPYVNEGMSPLFTLRFKHSRGSPE